jgi:O-antigen/teichoic acid export membrane protein
MHWSKTRVDLALATSGEVVQKLAGYAVLAILARHFEKADMGRLFFAMALTSVVTSATELGTGRYLVREVAVRPAVALRRLGEVVALRTPLIIGAFLLLAGAVFFTRPALAPIVLPAAAAGLLNDLYYSFGAFLIGQRHVALRLATGLSGPLTLVLVVAFAVSRGATLPQVLLCYVVAALVPLSAGALVIRRLFGPIPLAGARAGAIAAARASLPFFLLTALGILHFKVDALLLFALATPAAVATYETGYKLFEVSRFVVRPTATVFYPVSAALAGRGDWAGFSRTLRQLLLLAGGVGAAISLTVLVAAPLAVRLVWGSHYADTVSVLRILFLAVPALYLGFVATFLAGALHQEVAAARVLALCLAVNIALNLVASPRWGPLGAAWVTVVTETLAATWLLWLVYRALRSRAMSGAAEPAPTPALEVLAHG